jgi:hypothetical protein
MKTIKQVADEAGETKNRVKYLTRKLSTEMVDKTSGITYITDDGVKEIYIMLKKTPLISTVDEPDELNALRADLFTGLIHVNTNERLFSTTGTFQNRHRTI